MTVARAGGKVKALKALLFDLDETLYRSETGLLRQVDRRIEEYLCAKLGIDPSNVSAVRHQYYRQYGTTLRGVKEVHGVDPDEYCDYAYDIDLSKYLDPNPDLREILMSIPARKAVFSNSPLPYVERVLRELGIENCFCHIYDIEFSDYLGKPNRLSYEMVLQSLGVSAHECMFFDDQEINLETARELGIMTVRVGSGHKPDQGADYRIENIEEVVEVWADLSLTGEELKKTGSDLL